MPDEGLVLDLVDNVLIITHHGLDVGMRYGIKLLILELIVGANVDVGAPVLRRVAVPRSREDYRVSHGTVRVA